MNETDYRAAQFKLTITDIQVTDQTLEAQLAAEAALDGIYVIRTGFAKQRVFAPAAMLS